MRKLALIAAVALAGCVDAGLMADPNTQVSLMKGQGVAAVGPDGSRTFRFIIPSNAYEGVVDNPKDLREQHKFLISQWAARPDGCPKGYSVKDVRNAVGLTEYSGTCR